MEDCAVYGPHYSGTREWLPYEETDPKNRGIQCPYEFQVSHSRMKKSLLRLTALYKWLDGCLLTSIRFFGWGGESRRCRQI
jgi:hypothetical protein